MSRAEITHLLLCVAVFLASAFFLNTLVGDCFHPSLDEGIYLEGGERTMEGEVPYRDFFAFTGPMTYWVQAGLERIFGREMPMLRLSATLALALMTTVVFALTARFTDWSFGIGTAFVFLGYISASTYLIIVNHRWTSAGFAALALWAAVEASGKVARPALLWGVAGAAGAAAAWTTPSFAVGVAVCLGWLAVKDRRQLLSFCGGVALVSVPAVGWLAMHGALLPMIDNLFWVASRYSTANSVPYAYSAGGPGDKWTDETVPMLRRVMAAIGAARYQVAPVGIPVMLAWSAFLAWRKRLEPRLQLLSLLAAATFVTAYPRWDVHHFLFVMAPFAVLMGIQVFRLPTLAQPPLVVVLLMWASLNYSSAWRVAQNDPYFPTRAGMQRAPVSILEGYERLEKLVPDGATLYAYPYLPSLGYQLHARNPIRYSFLQPGMMSKQDEAQALSDLERHPPRFILKQFFPPDQILNTWPNSDRDTLVMPTIEQFITSRYRFVEKVGSIHFEVDVMELNP